MPLITNEEPTPIQKISKKEEKLKLKQEQEHFKYLGFEEDEKTNPRIRVYNEIVRHAYQYSTEQIDCTGIKGIDELSKIFRYVTCDYPEIFWLNSFTYYYQDPNYPTSLALNYRCLKPSGEIDIKQIEQKRNDLKKAAKPFLKGISKKDTAYDAFLKIYRRLILSLDYDGSGLNAQIDSDDTQEDRLRSLHSALVGHKVVCAGYASALQYLLHSVGIVCGYVSSETANRGTHAFNVVKIGKYCYYCDPTWGDNSNTLDVGQDKDFFKELVLYDYCLVPFQEFLYVKPGDEPLHTPNQEYFGVLGELKATNHEYYRYHKYFITNFNEDEMARIFNATVLEYYQNQDDCGMFTVSYRAINEKIGAYAMKEMTKNNCAVLKRIIMKACVNIKDKKVKALFDEPPKTMYNNLTHIGTIIF